MESNESGESAQELPKINREQVGYLGICGHNFPLYIGRNKIGKDRETCNIILNFGCISKEHALINIIDKKELMVMDLESERYTKLSSTYLSPYIPYRIKDGDMVQFGDFFGVVNILKDDDAQPITQDKDSPGIPVTSNQVSNINEAPTPLIHDLRSEPLCVNNKAGSSVTKSRRKRSKKPAKKNKTLPIEAGGPTTSTTSFSVIDNPSTSYNESSGPREIGHDSIANCEDDVLGHTTKHLPQVRKFDDQHEMQLDIYAATANKENNEETKAVPVEPKLLVIPEKASSFSIHTGQQCKDQCSYCKTKFRLFDKPCHIAQIKKPEIQKKVLDNEKVLTVDSCLCDTCYRYVLRRNNYPPRHRRPPIKHSTTVTHKFPKKRNIKVRRQLKNETKNIQNDKLKKKPGPKSKNKKSKAADDKIDGESSEKPNDSTLDEIIVIESSDDEKQQRLDQNKTPVPDDYNHQSNSSEADRQTELKQQKDPTQFPPNLGVIKKLKKVQNVKRSIQDPDSLHKTQEEHIKKVDLKPDAPQNVGFCKAFEEYMAKTNILKKIPKNEQWTIESTANKKPADIILMRSLVKNAKNEENREDIVKDHITIVDNITLSKECSIEIIPKKKISDMNISKNKTQTSENTTQVTSENIGHTKQSNSVKSVNKESGNGVQDLKKSPIVSNVSLKESSIDGTPKMKHPDIIYTKGKWLIKKELNEMLKKENKSKVKFVKRSIPMNSYNKENGAKEGIPIVRNVSLNEGSDVETAPNKTPPNINISKNKGHVKKTPTEISKNKNNLESEDHVKMLETNPSISIRKMVPGESEMNLQCNIEFNNVKGVTSQGWEKCNFTIQFDEETKKVWNELQGPYGNRSSFLRHLVRLEKYFRQGDLILSPRVDPHSPVQ
ncbi:uncharacterized protein LOC111356409 isoform X2 [Spodoptera litura]|uniref:Uncharacterized protein LOC111356409 isoform X2 n=1 Tax=Spodoptera litura TaxID=69820 RepID=A0A9J7E948_SPOLT|nr:uncharacterized protein LOC111356409 isoform X2 [Spodoptera litura]